VLGLAVVATVVLTQAVAVASGALLTGVTARRVAYLAVSAVLLAAAIAWYGRRAQASDPDPDRDPGARPAPILLAACVAVTWLAATILLFV
jgi:hypothetical protein